jgi:hypothetical protein
MTGRCHRRRESALWPLLVVLALLLAGFDLGAPTAAFAGPPQAKAVRAGWNLLAGDAGSDCLGQLLFGYSGAGYESTTADALVAGRGYWGKFASAATVSLTTVSVPLTVHLVPGWNLIGNATSVTLALPGGMVAFVYDGSDYRTTSALQAGEGAWVKSASTQDVTLSPPAPTSTVNLVFIHHSVGENWLNDGLCQALNDGDFHVADIYYGWTGGTENAYGDHTDTSDWPTWFTDEVMGLVYAELGQMTAPNAIDPAPGQNTIIMFKSCFPNSDVGSDITDEKAVYNSLLTYFQAHPEKMFVLCTPPPMQSISAPLKTRELCNWLTDRTGGWLKDLTSGNVFVFDLYNVLTDPNAHHRLVSGVEVHEVVAGHNTLYYDSDGDDHPNTVGNVKATTEFVPLLEKWYLDFLAEQ